MKKSILAVIIINSYAYLYGNGSFYGVPSYSIPRVPNYNSGQVRGYIRDNGTYVPSYRRTMPDSNPYNNYSCCNNVNPYTSKRGSRW